MAGSGINHSGFTTLRFSIVKPNLLAYADDPFLPWVEQEAVATNLTAELHKFTDRNIGHLKNFL